MNDYTEAIFLPGLLQHTEQVAPKKVIYHPCLIVEVLSPPTEAFDRGKKFRHYRRIDTLKEYVLIDADKMNVECYRLNERGKWELTSYSPEETTANRTKLEVHLPSVDFRCPISLLYDNVVFPEDHGDFFIFGCLSCRNCEEASCSG